jgi:hypothetical protein
MKVVIKWTNILNNGLSDDSGPVFKKWRIYFAVLPCSNLRTTCYLLKIVHLQG